MTVHFWMHLINHNWFDCACAQRVSIIPIQYISFFVHSRPYHGSPVICFLLTVICLQHDRTSRTSCKLNMSLSFFSFWRRHASLPLDVTYPGNFIVPLCRRSYPCRKWKSASLG